VTATLRRPPVRLTRSVPDAALTVGGVALLLLAAQPVARYSVPGAEVAGFRRWWLALGLLVAGTGTYLAAKVVKGSRPRGRPAGLLSDVVIRGAEAHGRGFVSGHAATLTAPAVVAWPWLGRRSRPAVAVLVVVVCLARVYVGAHLPLDVVGGAALGLAVGGPVRLALGHPA
jgi:membrane-associated phospholipid phosphatase